MKETLFCCALLATASVAQVLTPIHLASNAHWPFDCVLHDARDDGQLWAMGASWKASFGRGGFAFVPYLPGATHDHPLHFRVAALRVGGEVVPFARDVVPARDGDRVTFDRGVLQERYDLALQQVEQSFVVDTALPGDVELELAMTTELVEDAASPGLQFGCAHGVANYGDAFVVCGSGRRAIPTAWANGALLLRVPAALRGDGPLVIDPILSSQTAASPNVFASPDVAYDATTERYLVVYEIEFSETDHDVLSLMFDGSGNPIANSGAPIDASTDFWTHPRVGNRNLSDNFLVVASIADPAHNGRMMIYGRTRAAGGAMAVQSPVLLSSPLSPLENHIPEIGSDPGTGPGNHDWLVAWAVTTGTASAEIVGRLVDGAGQPRGTAPMLIHNVLVNERHWNVQVSRSNGSDLVGEPRWLVTCDRTIGGSTGDVLGRFVSPGGIVSPLLLLDTSPNDDRRPSVSSPALFGVDGSAYVVLWERPTATRGVLLRFQGGSLVTQPLDLSAQFGLGRFSPRVDSDGARFLVTASAADDSTTQPDQTRAWTLGYDGIALAVQEGPTTLPGVVTHVRIAAEAAAGGSSGEYALAHLRGNGSLSQPVLTRYAGVTAGAMTQMVPTACHGVQIAVSGSSALGASLQFTLANFGFDLPGIAFGSPAPLPIPLCPSCALGLRLDQPILPTFGTATMAIAIPPALTLVGLSFAVQGFSLGSGSCLGTFAFSDTVVFTIR